MENITEIRFVRHADALPTQGGQIDAVRRLSEEGRAQATRLAQTWENEGFCPSVVLASHAIRTVETTEILCEELPFFKRRALYFGDDPDVERNLVRAFFDLGEQATLGDYLASQWGGSVRRYGRAAAQLVRHEIMNRQPRQAAVVGHGVPCLQAIIFALSREQDKTCLRLQFTHVGEYRTTTTSWE